MAARSISHFGGDFPNAEADTSSDVLLELHDANPARPPVHDATWLRDARRARTLSWLSLAWMGVEGGVGVIARTARRIGRA